MLIQTSALAADDDARQDDDIVVEAERPDGPDPSATSANVTVLTLDGSLPASADLGAVIDSASGATVVQLGGLGAFSAVSLRGASLRQVQVYLDGVPLNPDGNGVVNLAELPIGAFQRVELYRGNAPPEFAAAPIGGVVNLVSSDETAPANATATVGSHRTGKVAANGGWSGDWRGSGADAQAAVDAFSSRGDFTYFDDNGTPYNLLDDRRRERENNDRRQINGHLRARLGDDRLRVSVLDALLFRDEGLPGHAGNPTNDAALRTVQDVSVVQLDHGTSQTRARARVWTRQRSEHLSDPSDEYGVGARGQRTHTGSEGLLLHGAWVPRSWIVPSLTLAGRLDHAGVTDTARAEALSPHRRISGTATLAADLRFAADRVQISPVIQANALHNRSQGEQRDDLPSPTPTGDPSVRSVDPRIGLLLRPWRALSLKGNAGSYLRAPDLTELFGDQGSLVGNPALLPERGWQWDAGLRWAPPATAVAHGSLDLAHHQSWTTDRITWVQNSQRTMMPTNVGRAWVGGFEGALVVDLFDHIESRSNATRTASVNLETDPSVANAQLPRVPQWELAQSTTLRRKRWLQVGHSWSWTDGNYWDATNWYRAAPRTLHSAHLRLATPDGAWHGEVSALNLMNRIGEPVDRNPLNPDDDGRVVQSITDFNGYPLPGRTWLLSVGWRG